MRTLILMCLMLVTPLGASAAGKNVLYQVGEGSYEGYYVSPGSDAPLVLMVHDWDGLTDYEIQRAEMLAAAGYAVFAVDLFGVGVRPTEDVDKKQHTGELYKDRNKMRALLEGGMAAAVAQGAKLDNAVAMGYCFGGAAVLELARSGAGLKGFVTFHGGLATPEGQDYSVAKGRYLVLHGSADTAITLSDLAALGVQLEQHNLPHELVSYGGAPHAFTVFGSNRYREDADRKSWQTFLAFLQDTLK